MAMGEGGVNEEASTRMIGCASSDEQITRETGRAMGEMILLQSEFT